MSAAQPYSDPAQTLCELGLEMDRRRAFIKASGTTTAPAPDAPFIVLIIDELAALSSTPSSTEATLDGTASER